jgi:phage shock protein A
MAGLFRQFTSILKTGLDSLLEPAEDPRAAYSDPQERQRDLLARVREAHARNTALRQRLEKRSEQLQAKLPKLEELARQALAAEREDMARLALQQRQLALIELRSLDASAKEVQLEEGRIAIIEQRLTAQLEAMRVRQEMTAVRYTAAESQVMVNEAVSGISKEMADLGEAIEQAEQKAEHMQARASAIDQLADLGSLGDAAADPVAKQLRQLDVEKEVEEELRKMRKGPDNGL